MELYVVRHGETDWNNKKMIQGRADIEMNENGRKQIEETTKALSHITFDAVFASPLKRAKDTAYIITKNDNIIIDERLYELDFGELEGVIYNHIDDMDILEQDDTLKNVRVFFVKPEEYIPPKNGESYQSLISRVKSFLDDVKDKYNNKRVLLVSHATWIHALITVVNNTPLNELWSVKIANGSITKIVHEENLFKIIN